MISKLPRWVWSGSSVLAFIAGMINVVGLMGFQHQGITHLTGTTTSLGIATATGNQADMAHLLSVIGSFFGGCVLGGYLIQDSTLRLGRRYGVALLIESLLLFAAVPLLVRSSNGGDYLASCACGLQNGMVSTYSAAVLRTTHVSGIFTDLGICLGQLMRGLSVDMRRVWLYALLLASFFGGSVAGAIGYGCFGYETLYIPATLTGAVGLSYGLYVQHHRRRG